MKKILAITLILLNNLGNAETVIATGYGDSYDKALSDAKISAISKVAGTFIISDKESSESSFKENIIEHSAGVIKSYEVISRDNTSVTIRADVDKNKDNSIIISNPSSIDSERLSEEIYSHKRKMEIMQYLDDPNKAFSVTSNIINISTYQNTVNVKVENRLQWQPKWLSDFESFSKLSQPKGLTYSDLKTRVEGGILNSAMTISPYAAILASMISSTTKTENPKSNIPMVCFTKNKTTAIDSCYNLTSEFNSIRKYSDLKFIVEIYTSDRSTPLVSPVSIPSNKLYAWVVSGDTTRGILGLKKTFDQPAMIVYSQESLNFTLDLSIPIEKAKNITKIVVKSA